MTFIDRPLSLVRGAAGRLSRLGTRTVNTVVGRATALRHRGPKPGMDDVTLARKVETEIFRGADAPKGKVDVSAADGVVELRGEVKNPAEKAALEARVRKIPEVREVHNHLHLPKTPAPTRADSPGKAKRKTTESKSKTPRTAGGRVTGERKTAAAEPAPKDLAARGSGRQPAPLGSSEDAGDLETDPSRNPPEPLDRLKGA